MKSAACLDSFSAVHFSELQESPNVLLLVLTYEVFTTPDLQTHPSSPGHTHEHTLFSCVDGKHDHTCPQPSVSCVHINAEHNYRSARAHGFAPVPTNVHYVNTVLPVYTRMYPKLFHLYSGSCHCRLGGHGRIPQPSIQVHSLSGLLLPQDGCHMETAATHKIRHSSLRSQFPQADEGQVRGEQRVWPV